jgi:hypothetical protein
MRKRITVYIMFFLTVFTGLASAYFSTGFGMDAEDGTYGQGSLVMVVYSPTGNEYAYDLGVANSGALYTPGTVLWTNPTGADHLTITADMNFGIYGMDSNEAGEIEDIYYDTFFTSTNPNPSNVMGEPPIISQSGFVNTMNFFRLKPDTDPLVISPTAENGYHQLMNSGKSTPGWMNGAIIDGTGERSLAGLSNGTETSIRMYLYRIHHHYVPNGQGGYLDTVELRRLGTVVFNGSTLTIESAPPPDDDDRDGVPNAQDNCPTVANPDQADGDGDRVGNLCDNCPATANADQADNDGDGIGTACDNCAAISNSNQADSDGDRVGNVCDNCPATANTDQANTDGDAAGNACDGCPDDGAKTAPGACGCGVAETDSDHDGTPDCIDTDDDNDRIPDVDEIRWGLNPLDPQDTALDRDGDTYSNLQEYLSGTDPTVIGSVPVPPQAVAAPQPATATEGQSVRLDGSGSTGGSTAIVSYLWTQTAGTTVSLSGVGAATASFTAPNTAQAVTLQFRLQVTDTAGIVSSATATVTVNPTGGNHPPGMPGINAPADGDTVDTLRPALSVSHAQDVDGDSLTYFFEVYDSADMSFRADAGEVPQGAGNVAQWTVSRNLEDNLYYYWRARARDGQTDGPWTMPFVRFLVNTTNDPPTAPGISYPAVGASVPENRPTLGITASGDPDSSDTLTYEFALYADAGLTRRVTGAVAVAALAWPVDVTLTEDTTYWWHARAQDNHGTFGPWSAVGRFTINADNTAPSAPEVTRPIMGGEVPPTALTLEVRNGVDPEGAPLIYTFQMAAALDGDGDGNPDAPDWNGTGLIASGDVAEGTALTSWAPPAARVADNTLYHWRVRADDGGATSTWITAWFFTNAFNDPPSVPVIYSPADGGKVATLAPALTVAPAVDVDRDRLSYRFECYENGALIAVALSNSTTWIVDRDQANRPLKNHTVYTWRARAEDEHGLAGDWSRMVSFETALNAVQVVPTLNNPYSGGIVATLRPTLSVFTAPDPHGTAQVVLFEVYKDKDLTQIFTTARRPIQGRLTELPIGADLENGQTYYWRARSEEGNFVSAWMPTARFTVDLGGGQTPFDVHIELSQIVYHYPEYPGDQRIAISGNSPLNGCALVIPICAAAGLDGAINATIGTVMNPPALPAGMIAAGPVVDFGPSGLVFDIACPVTIVLPYSPASAAGDPVKLLSYDAMTRQWREVAGAMVRDNTVSAGVTHFSFYTAAAKSDSGDNGGGGGGGGGCFIRSLGW